MKIDEIKWAYPCGCGGDAYPVSEFEYSAGWLRVKDAGDGTYLVTKFGHDKWLVASAVVLSAAEFEELIGHTAS